MADDIELNKNQGDGGTDVNNVEENHKSGEVEKGSLEDDVCNSISEDIVKDSEIIRKKATQLLLLGKRNILIHDFQSAVGELAASCQLFKTLYGEQADEMGEPYFYYGKALFELARNESEVLGDQMQEDKDDDDEDDEDEEEYDEGDAEKEAECEEEKEGENNTETHSINNKNSDDKSEDVSKDSASGDKEKPTEESEEVNDLQLSWEYLELAKLIFQRNADKCKDTAIKLSEAYLLLGENGLESENYQTAIEDMKQALALQQKILPEEDRRIAETYYHLGVAHSLDTKVDEAITYFKSAITQLEKKIASLEARKKAGDKKTEEEEKDAFYTMDGEIESIRDIIKDIEDKISDMKDYKNEIKAEALKKVISGTPQAGASSSNNTTGSGSSSSSSVPVTDISHLIRKKRKSDNEEEVNVKKPKHDNALKEHIVMQTGPATILHKKQTFSETFCGADRTTYKWSQTISDLDIIVPVPPEVASAKDVDVQTTPESMQVKIKCQNEWNVVIDENFAHKTKPSEIMWSLEKGKHINIHIEKVKERWWDALLENEPKINLEEFELTRPMSDLTEEEEMTLQKIWSKQLEKNGPERSSHS